MPVLRTSPRRPATRVRRRRYAWAWTLGETLMALGLLALLLWGFYRFLNESPRFRVQQVEVIGNDALGKDAIRAVAGIGEDDTILFSDLDAVRARVESMPLVAAAEVTTPTQNIVLISVTERQASATLLVHNHLFLLDAEGVVLREIEPMAEHTGPLITGVPQVGFVTPGQQLRQPEVRAALELWHAFAHTGLAGEFAVSEINAPAANDLRMYCEKLPFELRWGQPDLPGQVARFNAAWRGGYRGRVASAAEYVDLRFENQITLR